MKKFWLVQFLVILLALGLMYLSVKASETDTWFPGSGTYYDIRNTNQDYTARTLEFPIGTQHFEIWDNHNKKGIHVFQLVWADLVAEQTISNLNTQVLVYHDPNCYLIQDKVIVNFDSNYVCMLVTQSNAPQGIWIVPDIVWLNKILYFSIVGA